MLHAYIKTHVLITVTIPEIIHRPVSYLKTRRFGDWILSPSSGGSYSDEPNSKS
jgi:hypothetical protein